MNMNRMTGSNGSSSRSGTSTPEYGAHELIVMNEALMTKSANAEVLAHLAQQAQDPQLRNMLEDQAQTVANHYMEGVQLLQGRGQTMGGGQHYGANSSGQPKLGLRQPSQPAPNPNGQNLSDRSICGVVLNIHKHGAVGWMTFALECADTDLRNYLVNGALMCDRAAYDTFWYMNQREYYQVPTLMQKTTNTMIQSYQTSPSTMTNSSGVGQSMRQTDYGSMNQWTNQSIDPNEANRGTSHLQ